MNCRILHELPGRLRIHLCQCHMTLEEADTLECWLKEIPGIISVTVYERTADAVIRYRCLQSGEDGKSPERDQILRALAGFDYDRVSVAVPEHSSRTLQHEYVNKLATKILLRFSKQMFLPIPGRTVITTVKAVPYLLHGLKSLLHGRLEVAVLDAASILVSLLRRDFNTAGQVMFLLGIGDIMDEWTHRKSINDLAESMSLNVDKVWVCCADGQEVLLPIHEVKTGETIVVRTGNLIPLDGEVLEGEATVNQASFTGESLPVHKRPGSSLYAGSVIEEGELRILVHCSSGSNRYDRIVSMIEESEKLKSDAEDKASHLADRLVPWTFGATLLTWAITRNVTRATSILMVDFCCALKLSMPIAVLSAMREAGTHHITVKGGKFMEACAETKTVVFDKTGTLTQATPVVKAVIPFHGEEEQEMLRLAACLEEHFPHSVANAVVRSAKERGLDHEEKHSKVEYVVAHGIASCVDGARVCIGSHHFIFDDESCTVPKGEEDKLEELPDEYSHLYLSVSGTLSAVILIEDPIKKEAADAIRALRSEGLEHLVMMTGDSERTARAVAKSVGITEFQAEVLPEEKSLFIRKEHEQGRKVMMIGDGINDSPALSEADAGIAINSGAAIAREIADITVSEDDLMALSTLRRLSVG